MAAKIRRLIFSASFVFLIYVLAKGLFMGQLMRRAEGYVYLGMYEDARRVYRKALFLDPGNSGLMTSLGHVYKVLDQKEEAIDIYERAITREPDNIIAYHELGVVYAKEGEFQTAKRCFRTAIYLSDEDEDDTRDTFDFYHNASYELLALCHEKLGEIDEALEANEEILRIYPGDEMVQSRLDRLRELKKNR